MKGKKLETKRAHGSRESRNLDQNDNKSPHHLARPFLSDSRDAEEKERGILSESLVEAIEWHGPSG